MKRKGLLTIIGALLLSTSLACAGWELYEKTSIKGTVTGTVKKGRTFEMLSGSIYEVTEITIQVVVEVMPDVMILRDGDLFKLVVKGLDEPLICKQLLPPKSMRNTDVSSNSSPTDAATTLTNIPLNQLIPEADQKEMGIQKLSDSERNKLRLHIINLCVTAYALGTNQGTNTLVAQAATTSPSAIESRIDGESEGFSGDTIFPLTNGQIWQQTEYYYHYHYAYQPKVLIFRDGSRYKIKLDSIDRAVEVRRLK